MPQEILLRCQGISVRYGGIHALEDVNIEIDEGEIVALMGPNGAGKSTVLKAIFGLTPLYEGSIWLHEHPIKPKPHQMVKVGVAFVPQGRRVFPHLSVEENLEIGGFVIEEKEILKVRMEEIMEIFPVLRKKRKLKSGALSGGEQQMLALARGLIIDPKVLLLDEPSLGLAPKVVKEVFEKIKEINERHKTAIMVVEHNIHSLLQIANRGYVLDKGKVITHTTADDLKTSDILEKVFLGKIEEKI